MVQANGTSRNPFNPVVMTDAPPSITIVIDAILVGTAPPDPLAAAVIRPSASTVRSVLVYAPGVTVVLASSAGPTVLNVESAPNPRFVRAVDAESKSDRLLAL